MNIEFWERAERKIPLTDLECRSSGKLASVSGPTRCRILRRTNWILVAIFGCVLLLSYGNVLAHGGGTPLLTNEPVGPYQLYVWSSPEPLRVGEVHMTFALVLPPDGNQPVDESALFNDLDQVVTQADIDVTFNTSSLSGSGEGTGAIEPIKVKALPSSINPLYYEIDTEIPVAGVWQISVDVAGDLGAGATSFQGQVEEALLLNWRVVLTVAAILFILILIVRAYSGQSLGKTSRGKRL